MKQDDFEPAIILMVEDCEAHQILVKRAFAKMHIEANFFMADDGEEALLFLRDPTKPLPDLILLDLNMPKIGGLRFLNIRQDSKESWTIIPVIMLTASDFPEDVRACYKLGANAYLKKPIETKSMIKAMSIVAEFWLDVAIHPTQKPVITDRLES